ncbi:hypothetical protein GCM10018793_42130 [Streptomyces sulfonofaciens]|uniref:Lipoprotein n=1 Tax=Streptomyces sulfonofaciens TaxID=68272 RepID=A0A919GEC1_9ACTN|nr:hypothetical protein [Streptomyces sulfonofaciens]GHH82395.1 hypothetical protein GCM10018793_42130 [Streptomyces sulfonofaciens]
MQRVRLAAAAAAVLAALATAGCSGGDGGGDVPRAAPVGTHSAPLVRQLDQVRSTEASRAWTTYGDLAAQRALGGGRTPAQLQMMSGYGWATTQERGAEARAQLGLDGGTADQVVEVGESHGSGRFAGGIDTSAVVSKARGLGARKDGSAGPLTLWRLAGDDRTHSAGPLAELSRGTADFNVLAAADGTLVRAASRAGAELLSADGRGRTLARDPGFRAVADCLGTPLAATLTDTHVATGAAAPQPVDFVTGAGVVGTDPARLTQLACRTASSQDEAREVAAAVREALEHGRTRLSGMRWRDLLSGTEVTVTGGGHVVRLTGTSEKSPQLVLEMLRSGDLSDLLDTSG